MMISNILFVFFVCFLFTLDSVAGRNKIENLACVIGNGKYATEKNSLPNAANDARDIAITLKEKMNYYVIETIDSSSEKIFSDFSEFERLSKKAKKIIIFYAGHSVQINEVNYLQPIDVLDNQSSEKRYEDLKKWMKMQNIVNVLSSSKAHSILFLDACRNNPFFISGKKISLKKY